MPLCAAVLLALAGCVRSVGPVRLHSDGGSGGAASRGDLPVPQPPVTSSTSSPRPSGGASSSSSFPETTAVPCAGRPPNDRILAALRRVPDLMPTGSLAVRTGPLCSGAWQYTVVAATGREPLQVLTTTGAGDAVTVVTAGTNVCTPQVRATAPQGILTLVHC